MEQSREFIADNVFELNKAAEYIIERLDKRPIVVFYGAMGAGKTTLIREIAQQLEVEDDVSSPTFAIINQYYSPHGYDLYHFDFYRLENIEEAFDMGYEEYLFNGDLCLIEWPEKIEGLLPENIVTVRIERQGQQERRVITVEG